MSASMLNAHSTKKLQVAVLRLQFQHEHQRVQLSSVGKHSCTPVNHSWLFRQDAYLLPAQL